MEKVAWIVGASFCGSSLLNLLLDTQPTIRGLGEGSQIYFQNPDPDAWPQRLAGGPCALCKTVAADCTLYSRYRGEPFYEFNFREYGCRVLVDSSKSTNMLRAKKFEPRYAYFAVVLSKTPHAAAYSWRQHARWDRWSARAAELGSVEASLAEYILTYRDYLTQLRRFAAARVTMVHYEELVRAPSKTIHHLCEVLEEPFADQRLRGSWWRTQTHILGGNPAIIAQISGDNGLAFAVPPAQYLDGKYADKSGRIFVDDAWQDDRAFVEGCQREYRNREAELRALLPELGYEFDALVAQLDQCRAMARTW